MRTPTSAPTAASTATTASKAPSATRPGFQPAARRRNRVALGVALAAIAIGGNLFVYSTLDDAEPVVQVIRDVPAGERITSEMLRTVDVDADPTVALVPGAELDRLVGSYAKVRLVSGSLVTPQSIQAEPLVRAGNAVVAVQVPAGGLPVGLRERVPVTVVIPDDRTTVDAPTVTSVSGVVVALPVSVDSALGIESISIEVAAADAATVAAADDVRIVLVEPGADEP